MMNVVEPDIPSEPLHYLRQFIIGAALQCGANRIPIFMTIPIIILELMLNIEHPYPECEGDHRDGKLNQEIGFEADCKVRGTQDRQNPQIREMYTHTLTLAEPLVRKPV